MPLDLYIATRTSSTGAFEPAVALAINSPADDDYEATLSGDARTLVFMRSGANYDLFVSSRSTTADSFAMAVLLSGVNTSGFEGYPYLRPDNAVIYFSRAPSNAPIVNSDVHRAVQDGSGFGVSLPVAEINTAEEERLAAIAPDERVIYWASTRADGSKGGYDMYMASRTSTSEPFSNLRNVSELNTAANDYPNWVSPDGCRLYFWSDGTKVVSVARR